MSQCSVNDLLQSACASDFRDLTEEDYEGLRLQLLCNISEAEPPLDPPLPPVAGEPTGLAADTFTANWSASAGATAYFLDVATDAGFTMFLAGYNNLAVGNVTSALVAGITLGTTYYYRVRASNASGTSANSNVIDVLMSTLLLDILQAYHFAAFTANVPRRTLSAVDPTDYLEEHGTVVPAAGFGNIPNSITVNGNVGAFLTATMATTYPDCSIAEGDNRTFAMWVNPSIDSNGSFMGIWDNTAFPPGAQWKFYQQSFDCWHSINNDADNSSDINLGFSTDAAWNHLVWSYNTATDEVKVYKNGVLQITFTNAQVPINTSNVFPFAVAIDIFDPQPFGGQVAELNIWGRLLTDLEVAALYAAGAGDPYPFNQ